jgi:sugar lactone lactonase YvrE
LGNARVRRANEVTDRIDASVEDAELVLDARAELGEGIVWDAALSRLVWVDIMRGRVHRFDPASAVSEVCEIGQPVGTAAPAADGSLIVATPEGFARLEFGSARLTSLAAVEADVPGNRMNDGACDPAGRFWAGTMALDEQPGAGSLYRIDPDGQVTLMVPGVTISNGLAWSGDASRMFYVDSPTQRIDVFDFDLATGAIANRRPFASIAAKDGIPDGLTIDADDGVWVALWGGGRLHRYGRDGALDRVVRLPVTYPTRCAFGGLELDELFVTSAWMPMTADERAAEPHAGGIYRLRPGIRGRRATPFGL